jgi:hypothetical protein
MKGIVVDGHVCIPNDVFVNDVIGGEARFDGVVKV